jgi:hypothetical protein
MSRTLKILSTSLLLLAFAGAALAENANQRVVGKKGVGYFSSEAPVGVRYWMSDAMAIDFGVGLDVDTKVDNPASPTTLEDETFFDWAFDVGLPFVLHSEENTIVYFRPGVTVAGTQVFDGAPTAAANDKVYDIGFTGGLGLGGEFFLGQLGWPNLSFSGQVGLAVEVVSPGTEGADSQVNFSTTRDDVSVVNTGTLGFHIYF